MPVVKLPITAPYNVNTDSKGNPGVSVLYDCWRDEFKKTHGRPGLKLFTDLGLNRKVNGLYYWINKGVLIAVCGSKIYSINSLGVATDLTGSTLNFDTRAMFATAPISGVENLFITTGNQILYTDGTATVQPIADADAPTATTHVIFFDQYILANVTGTRYFKISDVGNPLSWISTNFEATNKDDVILAIHSINREVVIFGKQAIEFWYNDGSSPFSRMEGTITNIGCGAAYSIVQANDTLYFMDSFHRFVRINGRQFEVISDPVNKEINKLADVADCQGDVLKINGRSFIVWSFPTSDRTFVYDYEANEWMGEWSEWITSAATRSRYKGNVIAWSQDWNKWLTGDKRNGKIFQIDEATYTDDGSTINREIQTSNISYDTGREKICKSLSLQVKRGLLGNQSDTAPKILISWMNENSQIWSNEVEMSLGLIGDVRPFIKLFRLGRYGTRQWRFRVTDAVDFILIDAFEEMEVTNRWV